jgi:MFS superfamily sulfate permease-like transporter
MKMAEQQEIENSIEEITDKLSVILKLNSEDEWNFSARELMSRIRTAGKIHVELESKVKEYFINIQSVVEAIHEINKKIPTFEIVNNMQDGDEQPV